MKPSATEQLNELFNLPQIDPIEQGKVWSELANEQTDDISGLLLNKLQVELILNQNNSYLD